MRYLVISDIHANLDALDAVLAAADSIGYERLLVLGDLVGYGAQPNEVITRIRDLHPLGIIRGNHDKVAAGIEDPEDFNPIAQQAAAWTARTLSNESRTYLVHCPAGPLVINDRIEICHGSPLDEDLYISSHASALRALQESRATVCFYGHTHIPVAFRADEHGFDWLPWGNGEARISIAPDARYLLNPGSVGQPRDGDPRAAFAIFDTDTATVSNHRIDYAVDAARERILAAGLPQSLANRLSLGR